MTQDLHNPDNQSLIEFPCDYKFKAMGKNTPDLVEICFAIAQKYDSQVKRDQITLHHSKGGKFISVNITVYVTCLEQVHGIYADLKAHPEILMTL